MDEKRLRVLIAYDGSDLALDAVRYVGKVFPSEITDAVLFYVGKNIPKSFWTMEKELNLSLKTSDVRASMATQAKAFNACLDKAQNILIEAGFPATSIERKVKNTVHGVVRDLVDESMQGYSAVVVGRRGHSRLKDILAGNVPNKLLDKINTIPLIVVGGLPDSRNFLVAFDGSNTIIKAVDHMKKMLDAAACKVLLCHVSKLQKNAGDLTEIDDIEAKLNHSRQELMASGFAVDRVACEILEGKKSLTDAIIEKVAQGQFGTVVVGRRGISALKELLGGRVGEKIFKLAQHLTVWVVR
ncbi:Nucleotide-binding universal stress protein, UspA family [Desulfocicer vacuolatum DSM 3385]|uniref:Nucleotide-binding universal stress protein, UspA family n=1 Tax=Desulfocicer vacuolatum DSM 3385 TaxID=1121400 RepID=A0A1W2D4R2_9BACT|nr:universal stress protein [Desulfocicer vacuolatum]SMC92490.1 Nucleotide-binding universal stress protein, UspA family [Desulfocicer vacuolatum DSM 3385]